MIIDTDIGGDPDDALALVAAARSVPELALVVTSDERGGDRARFAQHLLDLLDRSDVTVVAGAERRVSENDTGSRAFLSYEALYPAFLSWLSQQLTVGVAAVAPSVIDRCQDADNRGRSRQRILTDSRPSMQRARAHVMMAPDG